MYNVTKNYVIGNHDQAHEENMPMIFAPKMGDIIP